jgi:hypothetical protein
VLLPADRGIRLAHGQSAGTRGALGAACLAAIVAGGVLLHAGSRQTGSRNSGSGFAGPSPDFGIVAFDLNGAVPAALTSLGIGVVRGSCDWPTLEPSPGVYAWDCADNVIVGAARLGLLSYMTVGCTPAWADGGAGCGAMPADVADWYRFVQSFVARYSQFQTVLGVWNEPNLTLRDTADGANYALLYINASGARDSVNPHFVLAGPETSHHALASGYYVRTMDYIQGARALAPQDLVTVHWYPDGPPLAAYMDRVGADGVAGTNDVWLSEVGVSTPDAQVQADFYQRVIAIFTAHASHRWTHLVFYRLWDGRPCCSEAILNADYTPKTAFTVLRLAIRQYQSEAGDPRPGRENR